MIYLKRTIQGHRQSDQHWNFFKGFVLFVCLLKADSSANLYQKEHWGLFWDMGWGGVHKYGLSWALRVRYCIFNWSLLVGCRWVQGRGHSWLAHQTLPMEPEATPEYILFGQLVLHARHQIIIFKETCLIIIYTQYVSMCMSCCFMSNFVKFV